MALVQGFPRHSCMLSSDEERLSLHDQKQKHQRAEVAVIDKQVVWFDVQLIEQRSLLSMSIFTTDDIVNQHVVGIEDRQRLPRQSSGRRVAQDAESVIGLSQVVPIQNPKVETFQERFAGAFTT